MVLRFPVQGISDYIYSVNQPYIPMLIVSYVPQSVDNENESDASSSGARYVRVRRKR